MKYYLIAGEASGDLHGSNLMRSILALDKDAKFRYWGGDLMKEVSSNIVTHYKDVAFMGFIEVVKHLPLILRKIKQCKKDIIEYQPDRLVLIDYPGFNLRIAEWAHSQNIEVSYYISPQIWAWKKNRGFKIKKVVDKMITILPFENEFYKQFNVEAHYVGHPLLDAIDRFEPDPLFRSKNNINSGKTIALLPGSRNQEVSKILPIMAEAIAKNNSFENIIVAATPHVEKSLYKKGLSPLQSKNIRIIESASYDILSIADAALVSSGTATLETALFGVPQIVCYKTSWSSYEIGKRIIDLKYISLVNLIMDQALVKELIQHDLTVENINHELSEILKNTAQIKNGYSELRNKLGNSGASDRAAEVIIN